MGQILSFLPIGGSIDNSKLPVLDENYPQDVTIMESADGSATFNISIVTPGKPAEYTYQWYVNGEAVSGATSLSYTKSGLTSAATYNVYCELTNKAGTVTSRVATLTVQSAKPVYLYSGSATLIDDGSYNYRIKFLTSGTLNFSYLGNFNNIDIFLVGGGAGGRGGGSGGGSGYTINGTYPVEINTDYPVIVGAGGASDTNGGATSFLHYTANGGTQYSDSGGNGGSAGGGAAYGGSTGGTGGSDGSDGIPGSGYDYQRNGKGQGATTREFGETSGDLYAGGGGGGGRAIPGAGGAGGGGDGSTSGNGGNGAVNTGGGGGGGGWDYNGGSGGSGIVVIRNAR